MRALVVCFLVAVGCGDNIEPSPPEGPIEARVDHYAVQVDLTTRLALVDVTITPMVAGNCITIPFRAPLEHEVLIDGLPVTASVADGQLTACGTGYPKHVPIVLETRLTIANEVEPPTQVGFSVRSGITYILSWLGGCDRFAPCDKRTDQFAKYTFTVTHAPGMIVRCPGRVTTLDLTTTECDFTYEGGPTYSTFGIIGSMAWQNTYAGDWSGVDVSVYDYASNGVAPGIVADADYHRGFVAFMQDQFGPYPYGDELRILTAPTYWSGFEHPGNIVLNDDLAGTPSAYADGLAHVLDHEIAHMWAGDQTTLSTTYDFVWKEAMAEYLSYVYEDSVDPMVGATTARAWKLFSDGALFHPVPAEQPPLVEYYGDVYGPGPMILFRQIEVLSSREQVLAALRTLLGRERAIGVADVEAALAAATGLDLADYFDAWVHGSGAPAWPRFTATYAAGDLVVAQTNVGEGEKPCKFKVALRGAGPGDVVTVDVDTFRNGPSQTIPVTPPPPFAVTSTTIDPDAECLAYATSVARVPRHHPWLATKP
jgi:aminopeptidase N